MTDPANVERLAQIRERAKAYSEWAEEMRFVLSTLGAVISQQYAEIVRLARDRWQPIDELEPHQAAFLGCWQKDTAGRPVWQHALGLVREDRNIEWLSSACPGIPTHFHPQLEAPEQDIEVLL